MIPNYLQEAIQRINEIQKKRKGGIAPDSKAEVTEDGKRSNQ